MSHALNAAREYILVERSAPQRGAMLRKRKLTLKNADAFLDPNMPDAVFLIEKGSGEEEGEKRAVAYMRRGNPTLALDLEFGMVLSLTPLASRFRARREMNIVSVALHNRRADLVLLEAADV
jgi:hypothetical protein